MRATGAPFDVLTIDEAAPRDVYGYDLILLRPDDDVEDGSPVA